MEIVGEALARAFAGGAEALRRQTDAINAINVFPVPDGDTGTNMSLTMRAAIEEIARAPYATAHDVAAAAAHGALMGAKGNSGVILSQILAGIAAMPDAATLDARALAGALDRARVAAYNVVSAPKEGTILSAIAASARAALLAADDGKDVLATFAAVVVACADAVARTPEQLPVLKEAGVVDSGAQGLFVLLDGMLRALRGDEQSGAIDAGAIDPAWLSATRQMHGGHDAPAGFCTEYVITGDALDPDTIRRRLGEIGDSVLAVGGGDLMRVHVHTKQPDDALAYGRTLGTVSHEKVDDMDAQFQALASRNGASAGDPSTATALAVVAVAPGDGIDALFRSMGAAAIVRGGQTMNPSAGDIRAAIDASGGRDVIVLPNNKNVVLAAKQAAASATARVHVIETRSIPHGVAALVAFNTDETFDENVTQMTDAIANVHSAEVTLAARATTLNGIAIREGQPIGIIDAELAVAEDTLIATVIACVRSMVSDPAEAIVTLYAGEAHTTEESDDIAATLRDDPGIEIELVDGGQPHYPYLIGVE